MDKARGGRGRRAENKYERFTVTLPPELKEYLDTLSQQRGVSRSEAVALVLTEHKTRHTGMSSRGPLSQRRVLPESLRHLLPSANKTSHTGMTEPELEGGMGEQSSTATSSRGWPKEQRPELPNIDGITAFKVTSAELSGATKNLLRWKPERYAELEQQLEEGTTIRLVWAHGKQVWRTEAGTTLRRDTVARLYGFGNLEPLT